MHKSTDLLAEHPLRQRLNDEFHARPPLPLQGSMLVTHIAVLHDHADAQAERDHLTALAQLVPGQFAEHSDAHQIYDAGSFLLRWELHTEFTSYTVFRPVLAGAGLGQPMSAHELLPPGWLKSIPGKMIVAAQIELRSQDEIDPQSVTAGLSPSGKQMVVSRVADDTAWVFTDFLIEDGYTRFLVLNAGLTQRQTGRTIQRLCEIETYRVLALLGLPVAREVGRWLRGAEDELAKLTEEIGHATTAQDEQRILNHLSRLATEVEHSAARTTFRFAASKAYHGLVLQRVEELRETRVKGFPPFREFMDRRLLPPMDTCSAMARRQDELSQRLSRNSQLLRTRVEVELERQNQELLSQMNQRATLQLRLQETVEGLSVVAISYYGSQLVLHLAEGLEHLVHLPPPALLSALSIPVIALVTALGLRRLRRRLAAAGV
jgi:uncharacterized membrane-anchored protein